MAALKAQLTSNKQILYMVQWFAEFSDFQRSDFLRDHLPIYDTFLRENLLQPLASEQNGSASDDNLTNGLNSIDLNSEPARPPSIFQCRMKLFSEWYPNWSSTERIEFLLRLRNIDSTFMSEFYHSFFCRNAIDSFETLKNRTKEGDETTELFKRLDINEKIFELKLSVVQDEDPVDSINFNCENNEKSVHNSPDILSNVTEPISSENVSNGESPQNDNMSSQSVQHSNNNKEDEMKLLMEPNNVSENFETLNNEVNAAEEVVSVMVTDEKLLNGLEIVDEPTVIVSKEKTTPPDLITCDME